MGKIKVTREVTERDISHMECLVAVYNTMFLMSSLFIILIASVTQELFHDFNRILSPSLALLIVGGFIVLIAVLGYIGIERRSSSLISLYTMLLIFIFVMEMSVGLGILSFRKDIQTTVNAKMKKTISTYPYDPMTANLVDYVQLKMRCCGINGFRDWDAILDDSYPTNCKISTFSLPSSCCTGSANTTGLVLNRKGCLPEVSYFLHKNSLALTLAIVAICTIQILGAYFSYALAASLSKYKAQRAAKSELQQAPQVGLDVNYHEKSCYF